MKTFRISDAASCLPQAYLSNGLVGLRIAPVPLPRGTALVNGFVGVSPENGSEQLAQAPYPVGADVMVGSTWLSERPDLAVFRSQEYDFSCGELRSQFDFHVGEVTVNLEVLTFCSRTHPTLVLQEVAATVNRPCELTLQANLDPRGLMGSLVHTTRPVRDDQFVPGHDKDGILAWRSRGDLATLGVSYASQFAGEGAVRRRRNNYGHEQDMQLTEHAVCAQPGRRYVMRQLASAVSSLLHGEPHWQSSRLLGAGLWLGFDQLRELNRQAWAELWRGRVRILGADPFMQDIADSAYFYLHSSVHPSMPCSAAPFGLGRRTEYSGNVFWDCETFMFPPVLLTAPHVARAMLDYRSQRIQAARDNARLNGLRGVQFPMQSASRGDEVTPFYAGGCGGIMEHHLNLDVAFAFAQYVHATGDETFLRQQAWPVLEGVAEWLVSRVTRTGRGYEIRHVTGIDEGIDNIHNNAETNMLAIVVLREAQAMARRVGFTPPPAWGDIERHMFLPIDSGNVLLKHDAYEYKGGMCIPETMAAFFPFNYSHSPAVDKATAQYYLQLAPSYFGMPMLSALAGVWAARENERVLSRKFFELGIQPHVVEPFMQFNEVASHVQAAFLGFSAKCQTVFLTNPAGFLMSLMMGLPGLQLDSGEPQAWGKRPVVMPDGWEGIEVERIWARGRPARLLALHGQCKAQLEFLP